MWWRRRSAGRLSAVAETVCRVCGWDDGEDFYDHTGSPTYIICDCCGAESGVDEYGPKAASRYRDQWLEGGAIWWSLNARPNEWNLAAQMERVSDRSG